MAAISKLAADAVSTQHSTAIAVAVKTASLSASFVCIDLTSALGYRNNCYSVKNINLSLFGQQPFWLA